MPRLRRLATLACLALGLALTAPACKSSPEAQTKEWTANVGSIRGYAARYANFKAVIDAHVAVVEKEFEAAKGIADAEQQTEAMQAANAHLDELLGHFEAFDRDSKKIGTLSRDPDLLTLPARQVTPVIRHAEEAIDKAERELKAAAPSAPADAIAALKMIVSPVSDAADELGRLRDRARRDRQKLEKQSRDASKSGASATPTRKVDNLH